MRKLVIAGLLLVLMAPALDARRKKPKAGKVKDQAYTDKVYDFSMNINTETWGYRIGDEKDQFRLTLVQDSYETPPRYLEVPEYTKVPRIVMFVDTCAMGAMPLMDSLLSESFSSDLKDDVKKEFEMITSSALEGSLERDPVVTRKKRTISIDGLPAVVWEGRANYFNKIQTSATAIGGTRVSGAYGGGMVVIKHDSLAILFHVMSEVEYFDNIMAEMLQMVETLKFTEQAEESAAKEKEQG